MAYYVEKKHKDLSQYCFLNNMTIMDQWVWQRLELLKHLFDSEYSSLQFSQLLYYGSLFKRLAYDPIFWITYFQGSLNIKWVQIQGIEFTYNCNCGIELNMTE